MNVTATATRSGNWWAVEVPEIRGLFTQVKRLDQIAEAVTDAAAILGAEVGEVTIVPRMADDEATLLAEANQRRAELRTVEVSAAVASRAAVARLRAEGLSVRDIATLMGITPQRVSVLAR